MKIMSIFMIFLGMVSSTFSMEESVKTIENQHGKTRIYNIPEMTRQEKELEARVRDTIIKEIRSFPLKERLEIVKFINLMDWLEVSIYKLYRFEKYERSPQAKADKLYEGIMELRHKINIFLRDPRFRSDYSSDDPSKVYNNPPFSLASQKKIIEALSSIYYCGPYTVSLDVNYQELPDDFFPMKIMFLQPEESRKILIHNTFVARLPENIRTSASKIKNIHNSAWIPCSWTYLKDTYLKWVYTGGQGCVQEIKWTNLFQNNVLGSENYIKDNWDRTLQNTSQFLLMKNDGSGFNSVQNRSSLFNLAMYYGADEKDSYPNGTDIMFINNHGNVFYHDYCFYDRTQDGSYTHHTTHELHFTLKPDNFYPPEDLYNFDEVTSEEAEAAVEGDPLDPLYINIREYIEEQNRELDGQ